MNFNTLVNNLWVLYPFVLTLVNKVTWHVLLVVSDRYPVQLVEACTRWPGHHDCQKEKKQRTNMSLNFAICCCCYEFFKLTLLTSITSHKAYTAKRSKGKHKQLYMNISTKETQVGHEVFVATITIFHISKCSKWLQKKIELRGKKGLKSRWQISS